MPFSSFKTIFSSNNFEKSNLQKPCKDVFITNFNNVSKCNQVNHSIQRQVAQNIFFPYIRMLSVCNRVVFQSRSLIQIRASNKRVTYGHTDTYKHYYIIIHCTHYLSSHWLKVYSIFGNHRNPQINQLSASRQLTNSNNNYINSGSLRQCVSRYFLQSNV